MKVRQNKNYKTHNPFFKKKEEDTKAGSKSKKTQDSPEMERLQKVLARGGIASRRRIESWIEMGRIRINGTVAKLGDRVSKNDSITLDGEKISSKQLSPFKDMQVILYHKPPGEVCTRRDEKERPTVFRALPRPKQGRWINVGRLDLNTSGLLLFTNDGELAHQLMHPSMAIEREYAVRILGNVTESALQNMLKGVQLEDGFAQFNNILDSGGTGANHWYHVTLQEGRNREVRRIWESQQVQVSRLIRIRFGSIKLPPRLKVGHWQLLTSSEIQLLLEMVKEKSINTLAPTPTSPALK
ncbi:23S rRNA pseudouridine(2605) synthase RluB [Candidatus Nitrosacidococcus sp. I8]|uniref:23S rRNA pseudouridine(2605) synthase RluB n=1 Tax=Candidatus Nitrosacidococcus sp. I8 TaxID=2942908 RepID=UPI002226FA8A|nr:pseudouridine synthase [Candidatus Nitrosacidococcus sp. I8]CAH9019551.1 Ribosomal large subunit pseudouridine synthase B [Candidatus Nitrosacidococcus sp. I8]